MDIYYPMSTTKRHNDLVSTFIADIVPLKRKREIRALAEQCALVYWGEKTVPSSFSLVDISKIENVDEFTESTIEYLEYIQPDFMIFDQNPYLKNKKDLRTAGQPDLIVEVWSKNNTKNDRAFLQNLYATSPITEHWYIEQDKNQIKCYLGREALPDQSLTNILITRNGLEFDLRYLALG